MKRMLAMLLLLLLLTGCSRTEPVPAEPETPPATEQQKTEAVQSVVEPELIPKPEPASDRRIYYD